MDIHRNNGYFKEIRNIWKKNNEYLKKNNEYLKKKMTKQEEKRKDIGRKSGKKKKVAQKVLSFAWI